MMLNTIITKTKIQIFRHRSLEELKFNMHERISLSAEYLPQLRVNLVEIYMFDSNRKRKKLTSDQQKRLRVR